MKFIAASVALAFLTQATVLLSQVSTSATTDGNPKRLAFAASSFVVEGNSAMPSERFDFLTNYANTPLDKPALHKTLDEVRALYKTFGFQSAVVSLPIQHLTNGIVRIRVSEGDRNPANTLPLSVAALPQKEGPTFLVTAYDVQGNTVLPTKKFDFLTNYTGTNLHISRLREGLGKLQLLYRDLGFATVSVTLPQQKLTNGVVRVQVIQGKLASIHVSGNRYFSTSNVLESLPSLKTNVLLNTKWFQPELTRANQNPDRQIYPVVSPAETPGYTDLNLRVKDRLPLHGHVEINDKSTPGTPLLRVDTALQYNNLWQLEHQVGLQYEFSPQSYKGDNYLPKFYDQPMVASYSGFYRIPFRTSAGLRDEYDRQPVEFGYNEVTHQFNLPPSSGNPEMIFYASRSSSDTPVRYSPLTGVISSSLVQISSQSAERDLTFNENIGGKYTQPLPEIFGIHSVLMLGFDFKSYRQASFATNLSYFLTTLTNNGVASTSAFNIALPSNTRADVTYMPLSLGWSGDRPDRFGDTSFSVEQDVYLTPLESPRPNFQAAAGSAAAGDNATKITATIAREEKLGGGWSAVARTSAQWASEPLISNEQFPLGGTAGVRGYQEGEVYGDCGWKSTFDIRAPTLTLGSFPVAKGSLPGVFRPSWFMDYGEAYLLDRPGGETVRQWGTGAGVYMTAGEHVDARLSVGCALLRTPVTSPGSLQAYFSVGLQF